MSALRQFLKKNALTRDLLKHAHKWYFSILYIGSPVLASKYIYHHNLGKILNLKNPKDFNEKLQWLKLYWQNPLIAKCGDKYEVREYVEKSGCEEILAEIYGVYDKSSEINWDSLPKKFALKCTHGCGFNIICDNKDKLDKDKASKQLDKWLKIRIDKYAAEIHYSKMKPRIICEQYIETDAGFLPVDYKFLCFNGKAKLVTVCSERITKLNFQFVDLNWKTMDIGSSLYPAGALPKKPECFEEMIKYSELLAAPFPFVRIDLYNFNGKPILGEMTFTPGAAMNDNFSETGLQLLGEMLELPAKYKVDSKRIFQENNITNKKLNNIIVPALPSGNKRQVSDTSLIFSEEIHLKEQIK